MFCITFLFLYILQRCSCDWANDWMSPIQGSLLSNHQIQSLKGPHINVFNDGINVAPYIKQDTTTAFIKKNVVNRGNVRITLDNTLQNAASVLEALQAAVHKVVSRENILKESIANGRGGFTTATVSTIGQSPRVYFIRDGTWIRCHGMIQYPMSSVNMYENSYTRITVPRCIGQEVVTAPDPCVFNSVIKYETVPTHKTAEYTEDDFLCLKRNFNNSLEQYLSVPRHIVTDTCKNGVGIPRSLAENVRGCSNRVMADYTFYPYNYDHTHTSPLPLEYCEMNGNCKLLVAWHISNSTIENFEFLKNENDFRNYFILNDANVVHNQ